MKFDARVAFAIALWLAPRVVAAEPTLTADELRARGEALASDRHFTEAIDAFKAADQLAPRAANACLIGLAYARRELWSQAEIFLDACHRRAAADDELPPWVAAADAQVAERIAGLDVAAIELVVEPADAAATLTVSSFAPDERFAPRTLHLPAGHHVISATAPGYAPAELAIDVRTGEHQRVVVHLTRETTAGQPPPRPRPRPAASRWPWLLAAGGGAMSLGGLGVHLLLATPARQHMIDATARGDTLGYDDWSGTFASRRAMALGLYGVGAALLVAGVVTRFTVFAPDADGVQVAATPLPGGGFVTVGWQR